MNKMKPYIKIVLTIAMLMSTVAAMAAKVFTYEGVLYTETSPAGTCMLGSDNAAANAPNMEISVEFLKIPAEVTDENGNVYRVVKVAKNAFKSSEIGEFDLSGCHYLTYLDQRCFENAKATRISLPSSVETIELAAFNSPYLKCLVLNSLIPPLDATKSKNKTNFLSSDFLNEGVLYVSPQSVESYEHASWSSIPLNIRPIGYYESVSIPETLDVYVNCPREVEIRWTPDDAPFPGDLEWYIKEEEPGKEKIVRLEQSEKPERIILNPLKPGICTLVAKIRIEEADKDVYKELETKLNISYVQIEKFIFEPEEYIFESGGGIEKTIKVRTVPENVPMEDIYYYVLDGYNTVDIVYWYEKFLRLISLRPGKTEVIAMRGDEELGRMTVKVKNSEVTEIEPEKPFLEIYKGRSGEMRIVPDFPDLAVQGALTWTVKSGSENVEMTVSEDTWSASFKGVRKGEANITVNGGRGLDTSFKVFVNDGDIERVVLDRDSYTLHMNSDLRIIPSTEPMDYENTGFVYTFSDPEVAEIKESEDGVFLSPKEIGKTVLKVVLDSNPMFYATAEVTVMAEVPLTELTIEGENHPTIDMREGEERDLMLEIAPLNATDAIFRWSTDASESRLSLTPSEDTRSVRIEALKAGSYLLSATALDGSGLVATAKINVSRVNPESISIEKIGGDLNLNDASRTLKAKILPENASETILAWSVADPEILTIEEITDDEVRIVPKAVGTTVVSVMMCEEPWLFDLAVIKVIKDNSAVSVGIAEDRITMVMGESPHQLTPVIEPADMDWSYLVWSSSDESVVTVDENGVVTPVGVGTAVVTLRAEDDPDLIGRCTVVVSPMVIDSLGLNKEEVEIIEGWSDIVKAVFPNENVHPELEWSVSEPDIVLITPHLLTNAVKIEALQAGECILSVRYGGLSSECKVKVMERPAHVITLLLEEDFIDIDSEGVVASFGYDHEELGCPEVEWYSDDETVARIEEMEDGCVRIIPVGEGSCTIRVEDASDAGVYDSRRITVGSVSSVSEISAYGELTRYDLFDMAGRVIRLDVTVNEVKNLIPGIYILRTDEKVRRIVVK